MVPGEVRVNRYRVVMARRVIAQMRVNTRRTDRCGLHSDHEPNRHELPAHAPFLPIRSSLSRSRQQPNGAIRYPFASRSSSARLRSTPQR